MLKTILTIMLLIISITPLSFRPVLLIHGFSMNCNDLDNLALTYNLKCINYRQYSLDANEVDPYTSLTTLAELACNQIVMLINNAPSLYVNGFYLFGIGLGGLVARDLLQKCNKIKDYIKRIILVGTPHLGVSKLIPTFIADEGEVLFKDNGEFNLKKKYPSIDEVYVHDNKMTDYLNELNFDPFEQTESNYNNLEIFVNFFHIGKKNITPQESVTFGGNYKEAISLEEDQESIFQKQNIFYQVDFLGLAELHDTNRFLNCGMNLDYMDLGFLFLDNGKLENKKGILENLFKFFSDECDDINDDIFDKIEESEAYKLCLRKNIKKFNLFKTSNCDYKYEFKAEDLEIIVNDEEKEMYKFKNKTD